MLKFQQRIAPFLWFDHQAEDAARFYTSIFKKNSGIKTVTHYGESGPGPKGSVMTVAFMLEGQMFVALNGGPQFKFTEAISFVVHCRTQKEVDYYWEKLSAGGQEIQCGWLKDKYGLCWQIVPNVFLELLLKKNAAAAERMMKAMFGMKKLDIAALKRAYG